MQPSVDEFKQIIRQCRSRETSGRPERWTEKNPSVGQCLITALLANEFLGLSVAVEKIIMESGWQPHHYYNKDHKNTPIRFCDEQFANEKILRRLRGRKLSTFAIHSITEMYPTINQRYELLKNNFQAQLQGTLI